MPSLNAFRQVDEKHVTFEVDHIVWSPKMDLIAVAGIAGEVALHRLSWQKVWTLPSPSETAKVAALAWRPDGKVLAVGYSSGKIQLCDIENASCLHSLQLPSKLTCLNWSSDVIVSSESSEESKDCFSDISGVFLPKLPPFNKTYDEALKGQREVPPEDTKKLQGQTSLNVLVAGSETGIVSLFAYGIVHFGQIDLSKFGVTSIGKIISSHLDEDFATMSVVMECSTDDELTGVHFFTFDSSLLSQNSKELQLMSLKLGCILTLLSYLETAISQMSSAWEDILLEMDSKLKTLAEEKYKVCGGSLSTDFLRLLMFGQPSDELRNFLLFTLTDKGLKKLGHSIESSYTNIQKLLLKHVQSVGNALVYHLSDVRGMSDWLEKFGSIGSSSSATDNAVKMAGLFMLATENAVKIAGSFMLKASELQQVIDTNLKNFKAFFRWLYVTILRLAEEPVPTALNKMSQQDLNFVAQFLRDNFTEDVSKDKSGFKLEKVGQYLKRQNLCKCVDTSANPWEKLLSQSAQLRDSPLLFASYPELSLVQMYDKLVDGVDELIKQFVSNISASVKCIRNVCLVPAKVMKPDRTAISQSSACISGKRHIQTAFTLSGDKKSEQFYVCRQPSVGSTDGEFELMTLKCGRLSAAGSNVEFNQHEVVDLAFYDDKTLSILLQEAGSEAMRPSLVLLPITVLDTIAPTSAELSLLQESRISLENREAVDIGIASDSIGFRTLENMKASKFAVSGTRKVACVLFGSRRRVRLFLLDVEDEDEDEQADCSGAMENANNLSKDLSSVNSTLAHETDDENKENSSSDMTVDTQ